LNALSPSIRVEQIGNATLYCGDCRDVLPTLELQETIEDAAAFCGGVPQYRKLHAMSDKTTAEDHESGDVKRPVEIPKARRMRRGYAYYEKEIGWRMSLSYIQSAERMTVTLFKTLHPEGYVHE
jgi:hypothetical protein